MYFFFAASKSLAVLEEGSITERWDEQYEDLRGGPYSQSPPILLSERNSTENGETSGKGDTVVSELQRLCLTVCACV